MRDDLLTPIPGANPSGESLRYAPVYDKIKEARREDDDAPQGEWQRERKVADYSLVIKLAGDALAAKSKDLQLAAWLTEAALKKEGFGGLQQGLEVLRGLVTEFWDSVYPELEDGDLELRAAPLEWVGSYLEDAVKKTGLTRSGQGFYKYKESRSVGYEDQANESEPKRTARETAVAEGKLTPEEFDLAAQNTPVEFYELSVGSLDRSLQSLEALNELGNEKFGAFAPNFSKLRSSLEEVRQVVNGIWRKKLEVEGNPEPAEETAVDIAEPEEQPEASPGEAPARTRRGTRAVQGIEPADMEEAALRLAAIAKYLRENDPYNPAPYLMLRGFRWGELRGYGESPDVSVLTAPPTETRQQIKRLALDANWLELLETAETAMAKPCGRAWLDLQRYVVKACDEYGYPAIATAIKVELKALLTDLPALVDWTLADDTPTANGETKAWLNEFASVSGGTTIVVSQAFAVSNGDEKEDLAEAPPDAFAIAMEKVRSGRVEEAIEMLAQDIHLQFSGRARFQRRLQLAQLCLAAKHEALAQPILEELAEDIDRHNLEGWEAPDAVAHPLAMLYRCLGKSDGDAALKQKLYARICRLDPVQALGCAK